MNQNLTYFCSAVVSAALSYFINQLPNIPDSLKPWIWISMIGLTLMSTWLVIRQSGGAAGTSLSGNKVKGKRNKLRGQTGAKVDQNDIDGDENEISIDNGTAGSGRNP
jgi:hypothetical protein